ncbi:MAG TPA: DNA polymerase IV [Firmicutes bacterium]|nr:DNA polymerase IV [Candidatus Fermentithermobacillaceae bacterium]
MSPWPRVIILIDADAFFAAVEMRDNPEYRGKPLIIGAKPGTRGVVSTCSYEARKYGVRSAMPISQAYRLCPNGIYISPNMRKYAEASNAMFEICDKYTPLVERVSVDEGYLDVTPEDGAAIAERIRREIKAEVGIPVTAGVSYCKFLAKMAAEEAKPDGLGVVSPDDALHFLKDLPVRKIPGVGPKTAKALEDHGIRTAGDLRSVPPGYLETTFGKYGARLVELANGQDDTPVVQSHEVKSVSEESTFETDEPDRQVLHAVLAGLSQDVGFRMRNHGLRARTIGIKVRYSDFSTLTRAKTLPYHVNSDAEIYTCARGLLDNLALPRPVRLLGVAASNLSRQDISQPRLLSQDDKSWDDVSKVADSLRKKYGKKIVNLGATLHAGSRQEEPDPLT